MSDVLVPLTGAPRAPSGPETPATVRAEVRPAALACGDVPALAVGQCHELGLALDEVALSLPTPPVRHGLADGADGTAELTGTLVAPAAGLYRMPVLEVLGVPVLLLHRGALPPLGSRVLASGFLSLELRLWSGSPAGYLRWQVEALWRETVVGLGPEGVVIARTPLDRLPTAGDVDVGCRYLARVRPA